MPDRLFLLRLSVCLLAASTAGADAPFTTIGVLPSGHSECAPAGISPDGGTVVGTCRLGPGGSIQVTQAFRWTAAAGTSALPTVPDDIISRALDVTDDGTVVGSSGFASCDAECNHEAVIWSGAQIITLGAVEGGTEAQAVSADGSVVAGWWGGSAFRWTAASGVEVFYPPHRATGISADGSTIVGVDQYTVTPYRWTAGAGGVLLFSDLPGWPMAISADGSTIVGASSRAIPYGSGEPFRWTQNEGLTLLGTLPVGQAPGVALDVCAHGEIIVGQTWGNPKRAFLWDTHNGMRQVQRMLERQGVDLSGWLLEEATAISDDCRVVAGSGINPDGEREGWVATLELPLPSDLPATSPGWRGVAGLLLLAGGFAALRARASARA